jgi:hypothetical protein
VGVRVSQVVLVLSFRITLFKKGPAIAVQLELATASHFLREQPFLLVKSCLPTTTHLIHTGVSDYPWVPRLTHQLSEMFASATKHLLRHFTTTTL